MAPLLWLSLTDISFADEIPKSASGKILRRMLKVKYNEETKASQPKAKL